MKKIKTILLAAFGVMLVAPAMMLPVEVNAFPQLVFPVVGSSSYINDFNASRGSFGKHNATDIIAKKGSPIVAAVSGTVYYVNYPQPSWGYSVGVQDVNGYKYNYLHLNDDRPGTNDGHGGPMRAYAPDMLVGNHVVAGQLLGWVGDSGHSGGISHLHFEMETPTGGRLNPYGYLRAARHISHAAAYGQLANEILPYGTGFLGGVNLAMGNLDADPASEFVAGAGPGGGPHVKVYDANKTLKKSFYAYNPNFRGGVDVATGDIDNDGIDEIITGAGPGGGPHIKIFRADGTLVKEFFAYSPNFHGGVRVSAGDVDNDGIDEIITGVGPGGGPHVKVFEPTGAATASFYAYAANFLGGVDVAAGDVVGTSAAEIVTGAGPGAGPHVRVLNGNGSAVSGFAAYTGLKGGVRVSVGNIRTSSAKSEILTVPASQGPPSLRIVAWNGASIDSIPFIERWWTGNYDAAAGTGTSVAGTGVNRRTSIRDGIH
jgi:hypothetical protein